MVAFPPKIRCGCIVAIAVCVWFLANPSAAQDQADSQPRYQIPPKAVADLIDAPLTPATSVGPHKKRMLLMERPSLPPIAELAQPELRLAGMRINPRTNGRSRRSYYTRLIVKQIAGGEERAVTGLPADPRIRDVRWSPDGQRVAFTVTRENGIELWVTDVDTCRAKKLTGAKLNAAYGSPYRWVSDGRTLIAKFIPSDRKPAPQAPQVPVGPTIQENIGKKAPARTYQDLLKNAHDEDLFDHYFAARIAKVTIDGTVTPIGEAGVIARAEPSPDGKYIRVETRHRPYSYIVPASRFPKRVEIRDMNGQLVHHVVDLPLAEEVPIGFGAVPTGPRRFGWRADASATLYWTEALDGGDPKTDADVRDRIFTLAAPFKGEPQEFATLTYRYSGVTWGHDELALVSEWWWKNRRTRTSIVNPSAPGSQPRILFDRTWEDRYNDPGSPLLTDTPQGTSVLLTDAGGGALFYAGRGASPEGNRPFLDRLDLATQKPERLWRSQAPHYEYAVDLLDVKRRTILTRRESQNEPPNYYIRDLAADTLTPITTFAHPTPQLADVNKELIHYQRADGVKLTATLYLPPGYEPGDGPLPTLVWAYPQEFKSADLAGQVTDSPHRFVRVSSHSPLLWLVHGYAVLDDPSLPIIGEGDEEPNDTYVEQLVSGAKAAIDEAVRRGVTDRDRVAIGGHSYGAFMTANLLAHSDLFRAGIARSGAYNRTLTPFGFQAEERTFWEAPEIYFAMSPFMHADKVNEPILLIHGEADNNSGTFPIQSKRYYHALKGHGATVRLAMLPHESHGYRSRDSVMHMAWEMTEWLDRYVKNAPPRSSAESKPAPAAAAD